VSFSRSCPKVTVPCVMKIQSFVYILVRILCSAPVLRCGFPSNLADRPLALHGSTGYSGLEKNRISTFRLTGYLKILRKLELSR